MPKSQKTVIVLDLDDTLYKEADYQRSGFEAVCNFIKHLNSRSIENEVAELLQAGESDVLTEICKLMGFSPTAKESLLWVYRLHEPDIQLSADVKQTIQQLETYFLLAILTDGRSISQRLKLKALGLSHLPVYISEEYGADKLSPVRFQQIMQDMSAERYVYVGDNPTKDFLIPNQLGWLTIGLKDNGHNIHSQVLDGLDPVMLPQVWIEKLQEIYTYVC